MQQIPKKDKIGKRRTESKYLKKKTEKVLNEKTGKEREKKVDASPLGIVLVFLPSSVKPDKLKKLNTLWTR